MNICVFSVVFWDNKQQSDYLRKILPEWEKRINFFISDKKEIFLSLGSYSNELYNPTKFPLIQLGIERHLDQKIRMNYWKAGFLGALNYFLLNKKQLKWDLIAYIHYSTLIGMKLEKYLTEFQFRPESLMAPQLTTPLGIFIDSGLMFMKESAVKKWVINSSIKDMMINGDYITPEEETSLLFENDWYNPFVNISSMKRTPITTEEIPNTDFQKRFILDENAILQTPIIFGLEKHCDPYIVEKWKKKHPIGV